MENKITNKIALEFVLSLEEVKVNVEICEKLAKMLEQVEKKNAKSDKPTKAQIENMSIKEEIIEVMKDLDKPCQIKDIKEHLEYTSQKISALVRQLIEEKRVIRQEVKKVALFSLVQE